MWKSLTIITILLAGAGATIRHLTTQDAKLEVELLDRSVKNVKAAEDHLAELIAERQKIANNATDTEGEAETEEDARDKARDERTAKETEKTNLEQRIINKEAERDALNKEIAEFGNIKEAVEESRRLQTEMTTLKQELFIAKENFKNLIATRANTEKRIVSLKDRETMQKLGKMTDINARIAQNYENWGFVVISAGARQGVNARTMFDVKRGSNTIGLLRVTNLESNISVCDVVSVNPGERIAAGDRVAVSEESKWDPDKKPAVGPAPGGGGAAPAAPAPGGGPAFPAPGDGGDPLGIDPAPADDDPFGLGAPAAPAAPTAPAGDPFGLGGGGDAPAPATPAPAAEDPFGL